MPAVIAEGAEERLIDCAVHELGSEGVVVEHVGERVGLAFEPEFRLLVHVVMASEEDGGGFARVVDDCSCAGIVGRPPDGHTGQMIPLLGSFGERCSAKGAHTSAEFSNEEVIPRLEAVVICGFIADVELVEFVVGHPIVTLDGQFVERLLTQPAISVVGKDTGRQRRAQEHGPFVENLHKLLIDFSTKKECVARTCAHRPVKNGVDREANQPYLIGNGTPLGSTIHDVIDELQHMVEVADLGLQQGIAIIRLFFRYLRKHQRGQDLQFDITFNELLELPQFVFEIFLVCVGMLDEIVQPLVSPVMVLWHPMAKLMGFDTHVELGRDVVMESSQVTKNVV